MRMVRTGKPMIEFLKSFGFRVIAIPFAHVYPSMGASIAAPWTSGAPAACGPTSLIWTPDPPVSPVRLHVRASVASQEQGTESTES
jgi:hypothetical protein